MENHLAPTRQRGILVRHHADRDQRRRLQTTTRRPRRSHGVRAGLVGQTRSPGTLRRRHRGRSRRKAFSRPAERRVAHLVRRAAPSASCMSSRTTVRCGTAGAGAPERRGRRRWRASAGSGGVWVRAELPAGAVASRRWAAGGAPPSAGGAPGLSRPLGPGGVASSQATAVRRARRPGTGPVAPPAAGPANGERPRVDTAESAGATHQPLTDQAGSNQASLGCTMSGGLRPAGRRTRRRARRARVSHAGAPRASPALANVTTAESRRRPRAVRERPVVHWRTLVDLGASEATAASAELAPTAVLSTTSAV
jgi:hypothetical protein